MIRIKTKKSNSAQYVVSGAVAVVILFAWISLPLMSNSPLDSGSASGNPFRPRGSDINSLSDNFGLDGGAPGYSLTGDMLNNPATSGEDIASSLFKSGLGSEYFQDENAGAAATDDAGSPGDSGGYSASAGAPSPGGGGARAGKLSPQNSISGGNPNSMTVGGVHAKFFGSGANKADVQTPAGKTGKPGGSGPRNSLVSMLGGVAGKSSLASRAGGMDAIRGGGTSAFGGGTSNGARLTTGLESDSASSGLALASAADRLKTSDPSLNNHKVALPKPKEVKPDDDEEFKKMILQMILQATLGQVFGAVGQMMAMAINPGYKPPQATMELNNYKRK